MSWDQLTDHERRTLDALYDGPCDGWAKGVDTARRKVNAHVALKLMNQRLVMADVAPGERDDTFRLSFRLTKEARPWVRKHTL